MLNRRRKVRKQDENECRPPEGEKSDNRITMNSWKKGPKEISLDKTTTTGENVQTRRRGGGRKTGRVSKGNSNLPRISRRERPDPRSRTPLKRPPPQNPEPSVRKKNESGDGQEGAGATACIRSKKKHPPESQGTNLTNAPWERAGSRIGIFPV